MSQFDYTTAFTRTVGWVTGDELAKLREARIAIAGLGGVGGSHLLTLTRLGVGNFNLAEFDRFELHNFNRQAGAFLHTIGQPKIDVVADMARAVNPELGLRLFPDGVSLENLDQFLDGVDVYVDGIDYFAFDIRRAVFAACRERGIPAITAAPLGMGAALLVFMPTGMSFDDYFQLAGQSESEQALRFLVGLGPALLHGSYLVDASRMRLGHRAGPSTPMACELCAGIAATEALKLLLGRGPIRAAPRGLHFDAYSGRLAKTWRPCGNRNPIQRLLLSAVRRRLSQSATAPN
ncbi:MAG: ThiF family adenylyltransferase [Immundisolibacter sp.]|uniref:ThiF family adenylyltransferase n=1 Tax=Immundisolibacter sp. TaxID=1934948 RepID=UPI003D0DF724